MIPVQTVSSHYCWRSIGVYGNRSCKRLDEFVHCRNCPVFAGAAREALNRPNPVEALEESPNKGLFADERRTEKRSSILAFKLGNEWLGINTHVLSEVATDRAARRIAHRAGGLIEGLVNIRGELQLCLSLHGILEIDQQTPASRDRSRLVVIKNENQIWVFRAGHVKGVSGFSQSQLHAPPAKISDTLRQHVLGVVRFDGATISVLNTDTLFEAFQRAVFE